MYSKMKKERKRHQSTIDQARKAKAIEKKVLAELGNAASYVSRSYVYMEVGQRMNIAPRTAQEMLNNVPEAND